MLLSKACTIISVFHSMASLLTPFIISLSMILFLCHIYFSIFIIFYNHFQSTKLEHKIHYLNFIKTLYYFKYNRL